MTIFSNNCLKPFSTSSSNSSHLEKINRKLVSCCQKLAALVSLLFHCLFSYLLLFQFCYIYFLSNVVLPKFLFCVCAATSQQLNSKDCDLTFSLLCVTQVWRIKCHFLNSTAACWSIKPIRKLSFVSQPLFCNDP